MADFYDGRLVLIERADVAGFYGYHMVEHAHFFNQADGVVHRQ